ncbi:unnamed protein product [Mortierella alpina]
METVLEEPRSGLPLKQLDQTSLHLLPCGIQHDGKANIPGFFFLVDGEYTSASSQSKPANSPSSIMVETLEVATDSTTSAATTSFTDSMSTTTATNATISTTTTSTTAASSTTASLAGTSIESKPSSVPETSFRGRTLKGTVVSVPEGYVGSIYRSVNSPASQPSSNNSGNKGNAMDLDEDEEYEAMLRGMQEERKTMRAQARFKEFMIWGHDEQPSLTTDKVVRAMQWIDIAKVLHEPLY